MTTQFNKYTAQHLAQQVDQPSLKNKLTDDQFVIEGTVIDVSFSNTKLSSESKIICRHAIVEAIGGYKENGELPFHINHLKAIPNFIKYISSLQITNILEEFTYEHHLGFIIYLLKEGRSDGEVYSCQTILHQAALLNSFAKHAKVGDISWVTYNLISHIKIKEIACKYLEENTDIDILEWLYGGSLETVSFSTSMLMLNYALGQLESVECQVFTSYFNVCRQENKFRWWVTTNGSISTPARKFIKYGHANWNLMEEYNDGTQRSIASSARVKTSSLPIMVKRWHLDVRKNTDGDISFSDFHKIVCNLFDSIDKIGTIVNKFYCCSLGIISIVTGIRVHELANLKAATAITNKNNIIFLTTRIDKTHQGLPVSRTTGDAVSLAVNALLKISYIDKTKPLKYNFKGQKGESHCSLFFKATTLTVQNLAATDVYIRKESLELGCIVIQSKYVERHPHSTTL